MYSKHTPDTIKQFLEQTIGVKYERLYIKNAESNNIDIFIKLIFEAYNYSGSIYTMKATYLDPEYKYLHCLAGKLRSFDDIYAVIKTKFPAMEAHTIFGKLLKAKIYNKGQRLYPQLSSCSTIKRIRFIYTAGGRRLIENYKDKNIIWYCEEKYKSKWDWKTLLNRLNIHTPQQYIKYLEI